MKRILLRLFVWVGVFMINMYIYAQNVGISATGTPPDNSAMLDIDVSGLPSNGKKGLLVPRITTTERNALPTPANSLLIYNTTTNCFEYYSILTSSWQTLGCACTPPSSAPTANAASGVASNSFVANWGSVSGATCYQLDVATDAGFTSFVPGFNNLNVGNVTSYNVTGLSCGTTYYYRVRACNSCGNTGNSNVITVSTGGCCTSFPNSVTFNYTGNSQTWTVPPGVTCVSVDVRGAAGANAIDRLTTNANGGLGGRVTGVLPVTPGQVLQINVGGQGQTSGAGGWNGGGTGGNSSAGSSCSGGPAGGGGGASDIRVSPYGVNNRVVVAGGGGGAGRDYCNGSCQPCGCGGSGGHGGALTGQSGQAAYNCGYGYPGSGINGGGGGTQTSGGTAGPGDGGGPSGTAGALATGGTGGTGTFDVAGGGGGGGYYGGGGGGAAASFSIGSGVGGGGGGGGSNYASVSMSSVTHTQGYQSGNGQIIIYW